MQHDFKGICLNEINGIRTILPFKCVSNAMLKRRESTMQRENDGLKERIRRNLDEYRAKESAMHRENEDLKERIRLSQEEYRTKYLECKRLQSRLQQNNGKSTTPIINIKQLIYPIYKY